MLNEGFFVLLASFNLSAWHLPVPSRRHGELALANQCTRYQALLLKRPKKHLAASLQIKYKFFDSKSMSV